MSRVKTLFASLHSINPENSYKPDPHLIHNQTVRRDEAINRLWKALAKIDADCYNRFHLFATMIGLDRLEQLADHFDGEAS